MNRFVCSLLAVSLATLVASPPRAFIIGTLPEVTEKKPNDELQQSQPLKSSSAVINGVLAKSGDVDSFAVSLKKGQTLTGNPFADRE